MPYKAGFSSITLLTAGFHENEGGKQAHALELFRVSKGTICGHFFGQHADASGLCCYTHYPIGPKALVVARPRSALALPRSWLL